MVTVSGYGLEADLLRLGPQKEHQETGAEEPEQQSVQQPGQQGRRRPRLAAGVSAQRTQVGGVSPASTAIRKSA